MYRLRQREFIVRLIEATRGVAGSADRPGDRATGRRCSRRTRIRSRRSRRRSRITCSASSSSSNAMARGCVRPTRRTNRCPLGSCAITGTGFPIDRQLTSDLLGFDGADRQHLRQHCYRRLSARECLGGGRADGRSRPLRSGSAPVVHGGVRVPATGGWLRAVEHDHAAEAQPRSARARPRDRQQGAWPGDGDHAQRPQHAVRRHRRHGRRSAAARRGHVPRCGSRGDARRAHRCGGRSSTLRAWRRAPAREGPR